MASDTDIKKHESKLERTLGGVRTNLSNLGKIVHGMYDRVSDLVERTNNIYDVLAHRQDVPVFDPDDGYDLLDSFE